MTDKKPTNFCFKTLLLGGVAVVSTTIAVVLSQPHFAVASINSEICLTDDASLAKSKQFFSPAAIAAASNSAADGQLFWNSRTKTWMTDEQMSLMLTAYQVGFEDGGREHAELLQAVLLQETIAGQLGRIGHMTARVGKRSYGVMQVKVSAARDVLRKHKEFGRYRSDESLIVALMTDDELNMRLASKFLLHLKEKTKSSEAALVAYNIGLRASRKIAKPDNFKYVVRSKRNLEQVVLPFNQKFIDPGLQVASR